MSRHGLVVVPPFLAAVFFFIDAFRIVASGDNLNHTGSLRAWPRTGRNAGGPSPSLWATTPAGDCQSPGMGKRKKSNARVAAVGRPGTKLKAREKQQPSFPPPWRPRRNLPARSNITIMRLPNQPRPPRSGLIGLDCRNKRNVVLQC